MHLQEYLTSSVNHWFVVMRSHCSKERAGTFSSTAVSVKNAGVGHVKHLTTKLIHKYARIFF